MKKKAQMDRHLNLILNGMRDLTFFYQGSTIDTP